MSAKAKTPVKGSHSQTGLGTLQSLDLNQIRASVLLREAEQQRIRTSRQQAIQLAMEKNTANIETLENAQQWVRRKEAQHVGDDSVAGDDANTSTLMLEIEQLRQKTERKLQAMAMEAVAKHQQQFRGKYEIVARLLTSIDKQMLMSCGDYNTQLKECIKTFDELLSKMKSGSCGVAQMTKAQSLCHSLDALERQILEDLEKLMRQEAAKVAAAPVPEPQQHEANKAQEQQQQANLQQQQQAQQIQAQQQQAQQQQAQQQQAAQAQQQQAAQQQQQTPQQQPQLQLQQQQPQATQGQPQSLNTNLPQQQQQQPASPGDSKYISQERAEFHKQVNDLYLNIAQRIRPLQKDETLNKYRSACQRAINTPINAISAVSREFLEDKFQRLYNFISGQPISTSDQGPISVNNHPLARDFCLLLMAEKFVSQAAIATEAAMAMAAVVVSLWKLVPEFGSLLLACIYKEAPLLLPHIPKVQAGQTPEEFCRALGYRVASNGSLEDHNLYLTRQKGVARLYGAVMITAGRQADGTAHPFGIENGWRWLVNFAQLQPLVQISETVLLQMLETISCDMGSAYGRQYWKLLGHIEVHYIRALTADEGGPKSRLEDWVRKTLASRTAGKPPGALPANFW